MAKCILNLNDNSNFFSPSLVAGEDYVGLQDLPLGPFSLSQRRNCLSVALTDDSVCEEPEESFVLSLSTDDEFIEIGRDSVTVYIEDGLEIECG